MITVLIIEDDEDDFLLLDAFLKYAFTDEVKIRWVNTYLAALTYLSNHTPDVLLVDYNLDRDQNGVDLVEEVNESGREIPAILVTSQEKEDIGTELVDELFAGYLSKYEIETQTLKKVVIDALMES